MSVFLMTFLKLLSVCADLSSRLILDQRSGPKCLRVFALFYSVVTAKDTHHPPSPGSAFDSICHGGGGGRGGILSSKVP